MRSDFLGLDGSSTSCFQSRWQFRTLYILLDIGVVGVQVDDQDDHLRAAPVSNLWILCLLYEEVDSLFETQRVATC